MDLEKHPYVQPPEDGLETPTPSEQEPQHERPRPAPIGAYWVGRSVTDELGCTVGRVEGTVADQWLIVRDRRRQHLLAPVDEVIAGHDAVFLPFSHELIESAPQLGEGELLVGEGVLEAARAHYGGTRKH